MEAPKLTLQEIRDFVALGNAYLRESPNDEEKGRRSVNAALIQFLFEARRAIPSLRYHFRGLNDKEVPPGHTFSWSTYERRIMPGDNTRGLYTLEIPKWALKKLEAAQ